MNVEYGIIDSFTDEKDSNGDFKRARVIPDKDAGAVTMPLFIPFYWRGRFGNLQIGDNVLFCVDGNGGGSIIGRTDGEWDSQIRNKETLKITGKAAIDGSILVGGNADIIGTVAADAGAYLGQGVEVTAAGVNIGGTVKIDGVTSSGAMPFNGLPAGIEPYTQAPASYNSVTAAPLKGGAAAENKKDYE